MVDQMFKIATKKYNELVEFYGEDPTVFTPEEFFTILSKFNIMMANAAAMNKKEREMEEKRVQKDLKQVHNRTLFGFIVFLLLFYFFDIFYIRKSKNNPRSPQVLQEKMQARSPPPANLSWTP